MLCASSSIKVIQNQSLLPQQFISSCFSKTKDSTKWPTNRYKESWVSTAVPQNHLSPEPVGDSPNLRAAAITTMAKSYKGVFMQLFSDVRFSKAAVLSVPGQQNISYPYMSNTLYFARFCSSSPSVNWVSA